MVVGTGSPFPRVGVYVGAMPETPRQHRSRGLACGFVAAAGLAVLAGCGLPAELGLGRANPDDVILSAVGLRESDAASDAQFGVLDHGDEVTGQVSLDLCAADYPSEGQRQARHQVAISQASAGTWVSTESLLYSSESAAEQAMAELADAVDNCSSSTGGLLPQPGDKEVGYQQAGGQQVLFPTADDQGLKWSFEPAPDADWPQTRGIVRQAYQFEVSDQFGDSYSYQSTYLRRGRLLVAAYVTPPGAQADAITNSPSAARFIEVLAARMAALPASDVR